MGKIDKMATTAGAGLQPVPYQCNARITNPREQESLCLNHDFNKINMIAKINKFSIETQSPFNSPEFEGIKNAAGLNRFIPRWRKFATCAIPAGKYPPPWKLSGAEVSEGLGEANALKGQNNSAWGNALRIMTGNALTRHCGFNPQSPSYNALNKGIAGQASNDVGKEGNWHPLFRRGRGVRSYPREQNELLNKNNEIK